MYCIYCRNNEAIYGAYCRNCGRLQQRNTNTLPMFCAYCRADNPNDAAFCWNCGSQFQREAGRSTSDRIIQPGMPLPGALISGSQSLAGNVPMVQGTPQASSVPLVQGTPSALSNPLSNPPISQGAAISSPPYVSPPHEQPRPPVHHPGPSPIHHPGHPPIHHPEPPVHQYPAGSSNLHQHQYPSSHQLGQVSVRQTGTIARRAATGGARVAGSLSRRAVLALLAGGAATVAVGSAAAVVVLTSSSSPDKTVLTFCNALKNGDSQTAYNQLSSRIQAQTNEQKFASQVQTIFNFKGVTDCATSNVQQNGSTATVTLRITVLGFIPAAYTVTVIKENGVWKLDDAKFLGL